MKLVDISKVLFSLFPFSYKSDIFQGTHLKKIIRRRAKSKSSPKCTIPLHLPTQYFSLSIPSPHNINTVKALAWSWSGKRQNGEKLAWRRSWPSALHRIAWLQKNHRNHDYLRPRPCSHNPVRTQVLKQADGSEWLPWTFSSETKVEYIMWLLTWNHQVTRLKMFSLYFH